MRWFTGSQLVTAALLCAAAVLAWAVASDSTTASAPSSELLSVAMDGSPSAYKTEPFAISPDGRYVGMSSPGGLDLVPGVPAGYTGWVAVLRDRQLGVNEAVTLVPGQFNSDWDAILGISAGGRYVLASGVPWGQDRFIYVRDRETGTTDVVCSWSLCNSGAMTPDARYVVFSKSDITNKRGVFVRDRLNGTTERVSVASNGTVGDGISDYGGAISPDGRYVAFESFHATNLVPNAPISGVYLRDRVSGTTELISVDASPGPSDDFWVGGVSGNGRYVSFGWKPGDSFSTAYVRDRSAAVTEVISILPDGSQAIWTHELTSITDDGICVVFQGWVSDSVGNWVQQVFMRDRAAATTELVSVASNGGLPNALSGGWGVAMTPDGRYIAFYSEATDIVPSQGPWGALEKSYLRDRGVGCGAAPAETPTATATSTATATVSATQTATITPSPVTPTATFSPIATITPTPEVTATVPPATPTSTALSATSTPSPGLTPTPAVTPPPPTATSWPPTATRVAVSAADALPRAGTGSAHPSLPPLAALLAAAGIVLGVLSLAVGREKRAGK